MKHLKLAAISAAFIACASTFGQTNNTQPTSPPVDGSKAALENGIKFLTQTPKANSRTKTNATPTSQIPAPLQKAPEIAAAKHPTTPPNTSTVDDSGDAPAVNVPITLLGLGAAGGLTYWFVKSRKARSTT